MKIVKTNANYIAKLAELRCISEEDEIYVTKNIYNGPAYLKAGSSILVSNRLYTVYELTEDINELNKDEFIEKIRKAQSMFL